MRWPFRKPSELAEFFAQLPEDDPHHALPKGTRKPKPLPLLDEAPK